MIGNCFLGGLCVVASVCMTDCRYLQVISTIHLSWSLLGDLGTPSGDG